VDHGFIVHAAERTRGGRTEIHLLGRLDSGETFAVLERRYSPFFYVRTEDESQARMVTGEASPGSTLSFSDRLTMDGGQVLRFESAENSGSQRLRDALHRAGVRTYEADVKLSTQLLMDLGVHGEVSIEGSWRPGRRVGRIYEDPVLAPSDRLPRLTTLSLDIETDARGNTVYAVSLAFSDPASGVESAEVLFNGSGGRLPDGSPVQCFAGEKEMLVELRRRIVELDPDVITGWNVVDFDFRVLARRFSALRVPFDIGRSDASASFLDREDSDGTRWKRSKAIVPGRQVLDALWLVRFAGMGLEDYRLETVAQSVLGRGKRIEEKPGESRVAAVQRLYREDPASLCLYCREDSRLVLDILRAEGLLDLAVRKSLLIGTALEQTSMSVAAFEFLYMEHLHRRGRVAPTLGVDLDVVDRAPGGGIITPRAGLYSNVLAFDFKSLYPSIIRTFNIDPMTRVRGGTASGSDVIRAPNGTAFTREPAILPGLLDRFFESRDLARKAGDKRAVYAFKIVMNSFYGVLGTPGCRFAASALAGAVTTLGQHILFWTRDLVAGRGFEVIYGDTDSLFVLAGRSAAGAADAELSRLGAELAAHVNEKLAEHVRADYGVASRLELEFEAMYRRFFLPPMRTAPSDETEEEGESRGRAKGYAGLRAGRQAGGDGDAVEIVGMEAVRHDWTALARELQRRMLERIFHDAHAEEISDMVRELLRDLRAGRLNDKLVYRKSLRKRVEAYTKSSPPHARAAALLPPEERSGIIRYVMTADGPQPEGRLTAPPDYEHYADKQVRPIVEAVAPFIGLDTAELFAPGGQLHLF